METKHKALSDARMGLDTMEMLDCGRFSATAAREMANMDRPAVPRVLTVAVVTYPATTVVCEPPMTGEPR